jgi:molybdate transport system regulatory protein
MARVAFRFRIDFANGFSVGPGKIELLRAIVKHGSLSEAAISIGLSYRRAWLLVKDLNDTFSKPITTSTVGGRAGGGACVTPLGKMLISAYEEADQYHRDYSSMHLKTLASMLSAESRPATSQPPVRPVNPARRARSRPKIP